MAHKPTPEQNFRIMPRHYAYTQEEENRRPIGGQFDNPVVLRILNRYGFTEETVHYGQVSLDRQARLGEVLE